MEYKINRIDTDRRKQINEAYEEGIIHGYDNISIYKDEERKKNLKNKPNEIKDMIKKIQVNAIKAEELEIEAYKEDTDLEKDDKGIFLDVKT